VRRLQCRRIVDAVTGHRDDLCVRLQRLNELELLLGHDAGEDVNATDDVAQRVLIHRIELGAGDYALTGGQADLPRDRLCRSRWSPVIITTRMPAI
jgi:hypothetical protein